MSKERSETTNNITSLDISGDIHQTWMLRTYQLGFLFFVPYLVYGSIVLFHSGLYGWIVFPILALVALGAGAAKWLKGHIIRAWIITCILFGSGIVELYLFGWTSDARTFLLVSMIIASLLIHRSAGYGFWGGAIAVTFGYLVISYTGSVLTLPGISIDVFSLRMLREWILFLVIGGGFTAAVNFGLTMFFNAFDALKVSSEELQNKRETLTAGNSELQQLADILHKREAILDATASVTRSITAIQPLRSLLALTVDLLATHYGFEHTAIFLVDETETWLILKAASSEAGKKLLAQGFRMHIDEMSIAGWAAQNRKIKYGEFDGEEGEMQTASGFSVLHTEAAIPLLIDDEIVGVLDLQSSRPAVFDAYTINALQNLTLEFTLIMSAIRRLDGLPVEDIAQPFYQAGQQIISAETDNAIYKAVMEALEGYKASRMTFLRPYNGPDAFYSAFDAVNGQISFTHQSLEASELVFLKVMAQYGSHLDKPVWLDGHKLEALELPEQLNQVALKSYEIESLAIVPARTSESLMGVYVVLFDTSHCFDQVEMRLYRLVADLSALAIERNALLVDVRKRADHDRILGRVRNQLGLSMDSEAILRMTIQELGQLLGAELTVVDIFIHGDSPLSEMDQGEAGWRNLVLPHQNRGYVYDGLNFQPSQPQVLLPDAVDLVIPLASARIELGSIKFKLPENLILEDADIDLARAIALEAGQALESIKLYTEAQAALQEESNLYQAIRAVITAETTEEVLNGFANNLLEPGIDRCMLLMEMDTGTDTEDRFAQIVAAWDADAEPSPLVGQVWDMRQIPFIASDVCAIPDLASSVELDARSRASLLEKGLHALMVVPLETGEELLGWLLIGTLQAPFTFTGRQIRLYSNFANQLTQALEHIRLVQATESQALEEQLTREAIEHMREPVELRDVLDAAAYEMRRILDLEDVVIHLTLPDSDKPHH